MIRVLLAMHVCAMAFILAGCDNRNVPAQQCDAREVVSGTCTHTHYVCAKPMKLYSQWGGLVCAALDPGLPDDGKLTEIEK